MRAARAELLDTGFVRAAVLRLEAAQSAPDDRVAGTLLWYSLSGALARAALIDGLDLADPGLTVTVGPGGWPSQVQARLGDPDLSIIGELIPVVARASGAPERALWAIATDSVAGAALDAGLDVAAEVAACGPQAPPPRTTTVPGRGTVVRRGSCCLLYLCPAMPMCISCPRQTPEARRRRLGGA